MCVVQFGSAKLNHTSLQTVIKHANGLTPDIEAAKQHAAGMSSSEMSTSTGIHRELSAHICRPLESVPQIVSRLSKILPSPELGIDSAATRHRSLVDLSGGYLKAVPTLGCIQHVVVQSWSKPLRLPKELVSGSPGGLSREPHVLSQNP